MNHLDVTCKSETDLYKSTRNLTVTLMPSLIIDSLVSSHLIPGSWNIIGAQKMSS